MSMKVHIEDKRLLVVRIQGILRRAELEECQRAASLLILEVGRIAALILLEGFQGWQKGAEWSDVTFLADYDNDIEKIAIVGEGRWRDEVLAFACAGLRRSLVRYFNDVASARAWLASRPPSDATTGHTTAR